MLECVVQFYTESGINEQSEECNGCPLESITTANDIFEAVNFYHPDLESAWFQLKTLAYGLWLMAYGSQSQR